MVAADRGRPSRTAAQVRAVWLPLGLVLLGYAAAYVINKPLQGDVQQGRPNVLGHDPSAGVSSRK